MSRPSGDLTPRPPRDRLHEMARTLDKMLNGSGERETGFLATNNPFGFVRAELLVFPGSGARGGRTEIASNSGDLGALVELLRDMSKRLSGFDKRNHLASRLEKWDVPAGHA